MSHVQYQCILKKFMSDIRTNAPLCPVPTVANLENNEIRAGANEHSYLIIVRWNKRRQCREEAANATQTRHYFQTIHRRTSLAHDRNWEETRIMWYEKTRIWHEHNPRALRAWHESNAYMAQKEHIWKHQNGAGRSAAAAATSVPGRYHNSCKWCCCTYILLIRVHSYSISARTNSIRAHTNSIRARTYAIRARINSISSGSNCIRVSTYTRLYIILALNQWNPTQIE